MSSSKWTLPQDHQGAGTASDSESDVLSEQSRDLTVDQSLRAPLSCSKKGLPLPSASKKQRKKPVRSADAAQAGQDAARVDAVPRSRKHSSKPSGGQNVSLAGSWTENSEHSASENNMRCLSIELHARPSTSASPHEPSQDVALVNMPPTSINCRKARAPRDKNTPWTIVNVDSTFSYEPSNDSDNDSEPSAYQLSSSPAKSTSTAASSVPRYIPQPKAL